MSLIKHVTPACVLCEKSSEIELDTRDIARWNDGALIQDVWPNLSDSQRELIISGTHPQCWESIMVSVETDESFFDAVFDPDFEV